MASTLLASPFDAPPSEGVQQEAPRSLQIPATWRTESGHADVRQPAQQTAGQEAASPSVSQANQLSRNVVPAPEQTPETAPEPEQASQPPHSQQPKILDSPSDESSYSGDDEQEAAVAALATEVNMLVQQADEDAEVAKASQRPKTPTDEMPKVAPAPSESLSIGQKLASFASSLPKLKKTLPSPLTARLPQQEDGQHGGASGSGESRPEDPRRRMVAVAEVSPVLEQTTSPALSSSSLPPSSVLATDSQKQRADNGSPPVALSGFVPPSSPCSASSSEADEKKVQTKSASISAQNGSKAGHEEEKHIPAPASPSSAGSEVDTAWARALSSGLDDASGESDDEEPGPVLTDAYC